MNLRDCYRTLELEPGASLDEVKRSYRELAQVWHPDRFASKPALQGRANSKLKEINAAYRELVRHLESGAGARADDRAPGAAHAGPAAQAASETAAGARPATGARQRARPRAGPRPEATAGPAQAAHSTHPPDAASDPSPAPPPERRRAAAVFGAGARGWRLWLAAAAVCTLLSVLGALVLKRMSAPHLESVVLPAGAPGLRTIGAGAAHACGIAADGRLFCWGAADAGQLGREGSKACTDASGDDYACDPEPGAAGGLLRFQQVVVGLDHTCALADGQAYCWGAGYAGQLGDGDTSRSSAPVPLADHLRFRSLSALGQHTCGVTAQGEAYCWGRDTDGQLGDPRAVHLCRLGNLVFGCGTVPVRVDATGPWTQVSAGASHSCGLAPDGTASCWGSNRSGQLGTTTEEVCPDESGENPCALRPVPVATSLRFHSLVVGAAHTCGIATDGLAYCWGRNDAGQLGTGGTHNDDRPVPVAGRRSFAGMFAGGFHTCAVTPQGDLYCWGQNAFGQLGTRAGRRCRGIACAPAPERVHVPRVLSGSAGFYGTCVVTTEHLLCWGRNDSGQLGSGSSRPGDARIVHEPLPDAQPTDAGLRSALRGIFGRARAVVRQAKDRADLPGRLERADRW